MFNGGGNKLALQDSTFYSIKRLLVIFKLVIYLSI